MQVQECRVTVFREPIWAGKIIVSFKDPATLRMVICRTDLTVLFKLLPFNKTLAYVFTLFCYISTANLLVHESFCSHLYYYNMYQPITEQIWVYKIREKHFLIRCIKDWRKNYNVVDFTNKA